MKIGKPEYIKQVQSLSEEEQQKILSRMSGKLPKRLLKDKLSVEQAIAEGNLTQDLGGKLNTTELTAAIVERVES